MTTRAVRHWALAAVPLLVMGSCAPMCTPAPPPPPPPPVLEVTYRQVAQPTGGGALDLTADGRFARIGGLSQPSRVDVDTGAHVALPFDGVLTADGGAVVGIVDGVVTRHELASGQRTSYPPVPDGSQISAVTGISGDGGRIGVDTSNGNTAEVTAFELDVAAATWIRLDQPLGGEAMAVSSYRPLVARDGSLTAFDLLDGPAGCQGCREVWARRRATGELVLITPTPSGDRPSTGASTVLDVSGDGRFVLFHSSSTDLQGGAGSTDGRLFVRDVAVGTTTELPAIPSRQHLVGSISDDGQRVAFAVDVMLRTGDGQLQLATPALLDRRTGVTTVLARDDTTESALSSFAAITISADGRRVVFSTMTREPYFLVAELPPG